MSKIVDGVGRSAYCTRCGGNDFKTWWQGGSDWSRCNKCGCRATVKNLQYNVRELTSFRVYLAVAWLSAALPHGATRKQIADWLGLPKSPYFINVLDGIAGTPSVLRRLAASPLNGRKTWYYLFWTDSDKEQAIYALPEGIDPPIAPNWTWAAYIPF